VGNVCIAVFPLKSIQTRQQDVMEGNV